MAKGKRYYWLKLTDNFFNEKEIKKMRRFAGGDTLVVIYLEMLLSAMKNEGVLRFVGLEESIAAEIALEIDEDVQNVEVALRFLERCGMCEVLPQGIYLPAAVASTGSEGASAQRMREHRERAKLQAVQNPIALPAATPVSQSDAKLSLGDISVTERRDREDIEKKRDREDIEKSNIRADKLQNKKFVPPTLDEVTAYAKERGINVDPQGFIDFYESKGWMVGKSKMKDWKAACRRAANWETNKSKRATDITDPKSYTYTGGYSL